MVGGGGSGGAEGGGGVVKACKGKQVALLQRRG